MNKHHWLAATLTCTTLAIASDRLWARAIHSASSTAVSSPAAQASPVVVQAMETELARAMAFDASATKTSVAQSNV